MRTKKVKCEYCNQKLVLEKDGQYNSFKNQIEIASGGYTSVYIGINRENKFVIRGAGDDYTDDTIINHCPMCGKALNKVKKQAPKK